MRRERLCALSQGATKTMIASTVGRTRATCFAMSDGVAVLSAVARKMHCLSATWPSRMLYIREINEGRLGARFERSDLRGFVKGIFEVALERGGNRHCQRLVVCF